MIAAALDYGRQGLRVFPVHSAGLVCSCGDVVCGRRGKHPRVGWKTEATTDLETVAAWWGRWPEANIGLPTGAESFTVVDVDVRKPEGAESYREMRRRGLPETWVAKTGSGGFHLFFQHSPKATANAVNLLPAVDVRDAGGYIVAPPSDHASGRYAWIVQPGTVDLADQPEWLIEMRAERAAPRVVAFPSRPRATETDEVERCRRYLMAAGPAVSGEGGDAKTWRLTCAMVERVGEEDALGLLLEWNQGNEPPWADREIERKVRLASERVAA